MGGTRLRREGRPGLGTVGRRSGASPPGCGWGDGALGGWLRDRRFCENMNEAVGELRARVKKDPRKNPVVGVSLC